MKKLLFVVILMLLGSVGLHAQTCTASSTSASAVQTALNSCIAGGTVIIPAGSSTWTTQVSIAPTGPLTIQGATTCTAGCAAGSGGSGLAFTDNTNITLSNSTTALFIGPCSSTAFCTITGITFIYGTANSNGAIAIEGTHGQVSFRFHHNHFKSSLGTGVDLYAYNGYGLIDHYLVSDTSTAGSESSPLNFGGDFPSGGYANWNDATNPGSNQSVIVEDSNFSSTNGGSSEGVFDGYYGCKFTLRYSIATNFQLGGWHGTDSGGFRSCVLGEIYNNSITNNSGISSIVMNTRGGTLLFSNNTIGVGTSWSSGIDLQYYRYGANFAPTWASWGEGFAGLNWTPTTVGGTLLTLGASDWQASHSYAASAVIGPTSNNAGAFNYQNQGSSCTSNGARPAFTQTAAATTSDNTCTWKNVGGSTAAGPGGAGFCAVNPDTTCSSNSTCNALSSGDTCSRFMDSAGGTYPFRDQPGLIHNQAVYGNYAWNNTLPASLSASSLLGTDSATSSIIQSGRDYFNNAAPSGYTPYTYPDPLQAGTAAPLPPTNLQATPH